MSTLSWKVSNRAQSAGATRSDCQWAGGTLSPAAAVNSEIEDKRSEAAHVLFQKRPMSCFAASNRTHSASPSSTSSVRDRPSVQHNPTKKYWELGGLGPAHVATPEWEVRKERWLKQKAFGKAVLAANRKSHGRRQLEKGVDTQIGGLEGGTDALESTHCNREENDDDTLKLAAFAEKKDVAAAMSLLK